MGSDPVESPHLVHPSCLMPQEMHVFFLKERELDLHLVSEPLTNRCVVSCFLVFGVAGKRRRPPPCLGGDHDNATAAADNKHIRVVVYNDTVRPRGRLIVDVTSRQDFKQLICARV